MSCIIAAMPYAVYIHVTRATNRIKLTALCPRPSTCTIHNNAVAYSHVDSDLLYGCTNTGVKENWPSAVSRIKPDERCRP